MKHFLKLILITNVLFLFGCAAYYPPEPFVPYKYYNYPPPQTEGRNNEPTTLRCIDNSNIFVFCNELWWWAGPNRGWLPTGGGMYLWPRQVWSKKVFELYPPWSLKGEPYPVVPYPY